MPDPTCHVCSKPLTVPATPRHEKYCPTFQLHTRARPDPMTEERFWSRVQKGDDCWLWTGFRGPRGYGVFKVHGKRWRAHRMALALSGVDVLPDAVVCHRCDNPPCVRPDHLFVGTHADNVHDRIAKGRSNPPAGDRNFQGAKTHCAAGHPYDEANTKLRKTPHGVGRACRECLRASARKYEAAHRSAAARSRRIE